ncbi:hypothetical protein Ade02nite_19330 [Paractinoplanes deccanensis]|uniref:MarR family transcriptional regulator n=1 Tax=Paractinoplanes deccanensis TaxID=113561 RepID=A0ABQ3XZW0_9ACTN|nr:hypothetical protein [Actinoplanes deccanensis]GID73292.1 hypothetical protein Ade02nite_19330 [Actinoplanes deccanensis]
MTGIYLTVDDRRFLRAVRLGHIERAADGRVVQRGDHRAGRRDKALKRAREAGWVHPEPDEAGVYRLTEQGERDLAAREPDVRVSAVTS